MEIKDVICNLLVLWHLCEPGQQKQLKQKHTDIHRAGYSACPRRDSTQTGRKTVHSVCPPSTWVLTHVCRTVKLLGFLFTCCCCFVVLRREPRITSLLGKGSDNTEHLQSKPLFSLSVSEGYYNRTLPRVKWTPKLYGTTLLGIPNSWRGCLHHSYAICT